MLRVKWQVIFISSCCSYIDIHPPFHTHKKYYLMGQRPPQLSLERYQACLNRGPRPPKPSTWARTRRPYAPKVLVSATLSQNGDKWRHHLRSWVRATVSSLCQLAGKCNYLQFTAAFRLTIKYRLLLGKLIKIVINSLHCYTRKLRCSACTVFNQNWYHVKRHKVFEIFVTK